MKTIRTVTGLDIGSSKICAAMAELDGDGLLHVLAVHSAPSNGIQKGHIINLDDAVEAVSTALEGLKEKSGIRPEYIVADISGQSLQGQSSQGMVNLSLRGREITQADIARCIDAASTIKLPFHREIIYREIQSFVIDEDVEVREPVGLFGSRLAASIYAITANASHINNIQKAVNSAGYELKECVFSGLANAAILLEYDDKKKGVALIDIGASLTEVLIFIKGVLRSIEVLPFGGDDCRGPVAHDEGFLKVKTAVAKRIESFRASGCLVEKAVLTGGFSFTDGVIENFESTAGLPVKIGTAKGIVGSLSSDEKIMATTCLGIARHVFNKLVVPSGPAKIGPISALSSKISDFFTRYF